MVSRLFFIGKVEGSMSFFYYYKLLQMSFFFHYKKDKDEFNRRDVCECDGWVCVLEVLSVKCCFLWIDKVRVKD